MRSAFVYNFLIEANIMASIAIMIKTTRVFSRLFGNGNIFVSFQQPLKEIPVQNRLH